MKNKKGSSSKSECVKVAIRVRPMNKHEIAQKSRLCVDVDTANNTVAVTSDKNDVKTFPFDYVYPMETSQRDVYDQVAFPIVDSIFQGYNGTVFAYGQTGCGKTYTMMGIVEDPDKRGIIPNAFNHIFGFIKTEGENKKFLVRCSFVEIYNEEVRDLLGDSNNKLKIREDPKKGIFIEDLKYVMIKDSNDTEKCLNKGNKNRHVGQTSMNDQSSRSHSLFTVYLEIEEKGAEGKSRIKSGKLNLVDLAGSERVGKTNATGQTFDEGKKINLSLTALGSVIDALSSNQKHIPYKDSKLTRLLADSLGGNTKTVMFANISPASYNYDETVGTLRYASRAKLIKNAPKVNEDPKDALLRQYEDQIKMLKEQLEKGGGVPGGVDVIEEIEEEEEESEDDNQNNDNNNEEKKPKIKRKKSKFYGDFVQVVDDPEKAELMAQISELEKNMISQRKLKRAETKNLKNSLTKEELEKKMKEQEEENKKFKEYREQKMKENEEMEEKIRKLKEQKEKEEELLKNDANKLQEKIKELNSEIEDLKNENSKDRTDYLENVKEISRENDLYKKIIDILLNNNQFKKICEMSRYLEDDDKWKIPSFSLIDKNLNFANVKPSQVDTFIEANIAKRDLIIDGVINESSKKVIFQNYDNEEVTPRDNNENINNDKLNLELINNRTNRKDNKVKDKFVIDAGNDSKKDMILRKTIPENSPNGGVNLFLMNKKEREKFEELSNFSNTKNKYGNIFKKGNNGKIYLNPLNGPKENSFKGTVDLPPTIGNKNRIKLNNIQDGDY